MSNARTPKGHEARSGADPAPKKHDKVQDRVLSTTAELAYRLYEERGRVAGHQLEDWIEAEHRTAERQDSGEKVHA